MFYLKYFWTFILISSIFSFEFTVDWENNISYKNVDKTNTLRYKNGCGHKEIQKHYFNNVGNRHKEKSLFYFPHILTFRKNTL